MKKGSRIFVDTDFKKMLKKRSADLDISMIELTTRIAKKETMQDIWEYKPPEIKKKKGNYGFKL